MNVTVSRSGRDSMCCQLMPYAVRGGLFADPQFPDPTAAVGPEFMARCLHQQEDMKPIDKSTSPAVVGPLSDLERGFPHSRLAFQSEPKIKKDERGYFINTISENIKVYFEDYYEFLELLAGRCASELHDVGTKLDELGNDHEETVAYLRARRIVAAVLLKTIRSFYSDKHNLGVIMTPWCFGTVVLEKVEMFRDRVARGEAPNAEVGEYPYDVVRYINEIKLKVLMDILEFPPKAFAMRWQYSELVKRYSQALTNVTTSLQNILDLMKKHGK